MKKILSLVLAVLMLLSCMSFAAAEEKPTLTVWIPVYQFGDGPSDLDFWTKHLQPYADANNFDLIIEIKPWTD